MFYGLTCDLSWRMFHVYLRRMYILLLLGRVCCTWLWGPIVLYCFSSLLFLIELLSGCSIHYWKWVIENSYYFCTISYFSLQFCQCLLYIFGCYIVRWIYIYNFYFFLVNWLFYHILSFFVFMTVFGLKSILSDKSMLTPDVFFLLAFACNILTHPFISGYVHPYI